MRRRAWIVLLFVLAGCTRQAEPTPKLAALPKAAAIDQPDRFESSIRAIDLRKYPLPRGAMLHHLKPHELIYAMPETIAETLAYNRGKLVENGWSQDGTDPPEKEPGQPEELAFEKAGFRLLLAARKGDIDETVVELTSYGNIDLRPLPRLSDAKIMHDRWHHVSYWTAAKFEDIVEFCRIEFRKLGWREFQGADALRLPGTSLGFARPGIELVVQVDRDFMRQLYDVTCRVRLVEPAEPAPKIDLASPTTLEAAKRAIDLERFPRTEEAKLKKASPILCEYVSKAPLRKIADFYRDRLTAENWTAEPRFEVDDAIFQSFRKNGFLLQLGTRPAGDGDICFVRIENMGSFFAAQLPRLPDASRPTLESPTEVLYDTLSAIGPSIEFYRKLLEPLGWKEIARSKQEEEGSTFIAYRKNATVIELDIGRRSVRVASKLTAEP